MNSKVYTFLSSMRPREYRNFLYASMCAFLLSQFVEKVYYYQYNKEIAKNIWSQVRMVENHNPELNNNLHVDPSYFNSFSPAIQKLLNIKITQDQEGSCALACVQYLLCAINGTQCNQVWLAKSLGYSGNADGYPDVFSLSSFLNDRLNQNGYESDWDFNPSIKKINKVLSLDGYIMLNVNSHLGYPHRIIVVARDRQGNYLVHNSARVRDEAGNKIPNSGSYQEIDPQRLWFMKETSFYGNPWGLLALEAGIRSAAIYVQKKQ